MTQIWAHIPPQLIWSFSHSFVLSKSNFVYFPKHFPTVYPPLPTMEYGTLCSDRARCCRLILLLLVALQMLFVATERVTLDEPMPKVSAQYDYFGSRLSAQQPQTYGAGGYGGAAGGDMVNFDFQCRCQAKSALARTLSTPLTDSNQATQQHIQQLQEQVRKLQEQVNRSQQGKSAFEQFAQVLSLADGLDCNCSGASTPWMGWPSGVIGSMNGGGGFPPRGSSGGVPLNGGGQFGGGVMPRMPPMTMPPMGGGFGTGQPFGGIGQTFGGGQMYGPMGLRRI